MTTSLSRLRGSVKTINETSFAVAFGDATALILDGFALVGERRAEKFAQARGRVDTALLYTISPEEQALGLQLRAYLQIAEMKRWNV